MSSVYLANLNGTSKVSLSPYRTPDEIVHVQYAATPQCTAEWPYDSWNIPKQTVTFIRVAPKKETYFSDLKLDLSKFTKEPGDDDIPGSFYYVNELDGISLRVGEMGNERTLVGAFVYGPNSKDAQLAVNQKVGLSSSRQQYRFVMREDGV